MAGRYSISRTSLPFLLLCAIGSVVGVAAEKTSAQETAIQPENYALLIGVTIYEDDKVNGQPPLQFPEKDARAIGQLLEQSGYEVAYLLGAEATREAILAKLEALRSKGNSAGVCVVGFFGHGVEAEFAIADGQTEIQGCFCPFDTEVRQVKNTDGKPLFDGNQPLIEPLPASLVTMSEVVEALAMTKAGSRLLIADCCREMKHQARGRSLGLGANFSTDRLPQQTVMLFGCKSGEEALERSDWGHGAFTKALLEELDYLMRQSDPVTTGTLADRVKRNVQRLTGNAQNPHPISLDSIDLQLTLAMQEVFPEVPLHDSRGPNYVPPLPPLDDVPRRSEVSKIVDGESTMIPPSEFINIVGGKMQLISAGEFMMGDGSRRYPIRLTRWFYLSETEVSVRQFRRFVQATDYQTEAERDGLGGWVYDEEKMDYFQDPEINWRNPGFPQTEDHPVVQVSWNDAVAYCEWLSRVEKRDYRLPTEAEWEYACRAGTDTIFCFGDNKSQLGEYAWFGLNSKDTTHPTGQKKPNPWRLYDMHGNVSEWCSDYWHEDYLKNYATNPVGPASGSFRVVRGGSWQFASTSCPSAYRNWRHPSNRYSNVGFRVALGPSGVSE